MPKPLLVLAAVLVASAVPLAAAEEEGDQGASSWSMANNERCVRTTHQCVRWSADNSPTDDVSYECGGLYLFHPTATVLTKCQS